MSSDESASDLGNEVSLMTSSEVDSDSSYSNYKESERKVTDGVVTCNKFPRSRTIIIILSTLVVLAFVVIIILIVVIIFLSSNFFSNQSQVSDPSHSMTQRKTFSYPIFHTTKDGHSSYRGTITQLEPLKEPFVKFMDDDESSVMLVLGENSQEDPFNRGMDPGGMSLFEVTMDIYCCPDTKTDESKRRTLFGEFAGCDVFMRDVIFNVITQSDETLLTDVNGRISVFGDGFCPQGQRMKHDIISTQEAVPQYVCMGICSPSSFGDFLNKNPTYFEDYRTKLKEAEEPNPRFTNLNNDKIFMEELSGVFSRTQDFCTNSRLDSQIIETESLLSYDLIDKQFKDDLLQPFCANYETSLKGESYSKKYGNICSAGEGVCVVNVIVSLGKFVFNPNVPIME